MWPVCQFPGRAQQPSDSRYLLFLWQLMGRRCACWPVHHIWRFCWPLPCWPLHLPRWQCRQCVILYKCLGQWYPRPLACLWTMGSWNHADWTFSIFGAFRVKRHESFANRSIWPLLSSSMAAASLSSSIDLSFPWRSHSSWPAPPTTTSFQITPVAREALRSKYLSTAEQARCGPWWTMQMRVRHFNGGGNFKTLEIIFTAELKNSKI